MDVFERMCRDISEVIIDLKVFSAASVNSKRKRFLIFLSMDYMVRYTGLMGGKKNTQTKTQNIPISDAFLEQLLWNCVINDREELRQILIINTVIKWDLSEFTQQFPEIMNTQWTLDGTGITLRLRAIPTPLPRLSQTLSPKKRVPRWGEGRGLMNWITNININCVNDVFFYFITSFYLL